MKNFLKYVAALAIVGAFFRRLFGLDGSRA